MAKSNAANRRAIADDGADRSDFYRQMEKETAQQQKDMLFAAKLQNEMARTQTLTKVMTKGSDAMKDTIK